MQVCWLPVLVYLQTIYAKCYLASMQSEISHCPGGCSRKRVQQTLNLTLTSELTYSEMGYSEYSVPEQRI